MGRNREEKRCKHGYVLSEDCSSKAKTMEHEQPKQGYDPRIGGPAGKGTFGEGLKRPDGMPRKKDCDYVVKNKSDFKKYATRNNATVYIDSDVDLTGEHEIRLGNGVELVAGYCDPNRTENSGRGPVIRQRHYNPPKYNEECARTLIASGGKAPKFWGVSLKGPSDTFFDPRDIVADDSRESDDVSDWYTSGIFAYNLDGEFECIGCEFWNWTVAGVEIGARNHATKGSFYRCSFHDNEMATMGYGVEQYNGYAEFDLCFFDKCRHAISGFGYADEEYEVRNSLVGPGPGISHPFDMHRLENNLSLGAVNRMSGVERYTAGKRILIEGCTIMTATARNGGGQEGFGLRGVPLEEARIENTHFPNHPRRPVEVNKQGNAYRQEWERWKNFYVKNNLFGSATKQELKQVGAPMISAEKSGEDDDETDEQEPSPEPTVPEQLQNRVEKLENRVSQLEKEGWDDEVEELQKRLDSVVKDLNDVSYD